jgi:predicted nucleic acid-binding protein
MTETQFLLDTNVVIDLTENKIAPLPCGGRFVSIITEIELFTSPSLMQKQEDARREFLSKIIIIPLSEQIKKEDKLLRRYAKRRFKLPAAFVPATAFVLEATLLTNDAKMLDLNWPGLTLASAR